MKEKTLVHEYNKVLKQNKSQAKKINDLQKDLDDVEAESHILSAQSLETDHEFRDLKDKINKLKHRAEISDHRYKSMLGQKIKMEHILNRDSDDKTMEFH